MDANRNAAALELCRAAAGQSLAGTAAAASRLGKGGSRKKGGFRRSLWGGRRS